MAKNKIQIEVEVNGKMQKATVSAKKLKKALDGAKTSQDDLNTSTRQGYRAAQGAAQNTSNGTKAFAKQAGVVGGLVPIYATFAANVFAVSAAFNALRRAAAVQQLETSLERIGALAGRNLPAVAEDLKAITGAAVSTEQALKATAVATTSGFSQAQLIGLAKVARGAATALGRDVGDALDRLVRGTAKLEPEILDELGIIVRLDRAASDYAVSLGKTAQQLTQFEKTQAFVNATITQGLNKYSRIAEAVDPNPYDRLAAAFDNLSKSVINFINSGITPVIEFLSSNPVALTGALTVFASTLFKQLTPAIQEFTDSASKRFKFLALEAKKNAVKIQTEFSNTAKKLQDLSFAPKRAQELAGKAKAGTLTDKEALTFQRSLRAAIASRQRSVVELEKAIEKQSGKELAASQKNKLAIQAENDQLKAQLALVNQLANADRTRALGGGGVQQAGAAARNTRRGAVGSRLEGRLLKRVDNQGAIGALGTFFGSMPLFAKNTLKAEGAVGKLKVGMQGLGSVGRIGIATFGKLLPFVGQALFLFSLFKPLLDKIFSKGAVQKSIDETIKRFNIFTKTVSLLKMELSEVNAFEGIAAQAKAAAGVFDEVAAGIRRAVDAGDEQKIEKLVDIQEKLAKARLAADAAAEKRGGLSDEDYRAQLEKSTASFGYKGGSIDRTALINQQVESLANLSAEVENLEDQASKISATFGQIGAENASALIVGAQVRLGSLGKKVLPEVTTQLDLISKEVQDKTSRFFDKDTGEFDTSAFLKAFLDLSLQASNFGGAVDQAKNALADYSKEVTKLETKPLTRFSAAIEQVDSLKTSLESLASQNKVAETTKISELENSMPGIVDFAKKLRTESGETVTTFGQLIAAIPGYNKSLNEANDILINKQQIIKQEEGLLKNLQKVREAGNVIVKQIQDQEDRVIDAKISGLRAESDLLKETIEDQKERLRIEREIAILEASKKSEAQKQYEQVQALVAEKQRELDLSQRNISALRESFNIQKRAAELARESAQRQGFEGSRVFGQDAEREAKKAELQDALKFQKENEARIQQEAELKKSQILVEYTLLDAKYAYLQAELDATNRRLQAESQSLRDRAEAETDEAKKKQLLGQAGSIDAQLPGLTQAKTDLQALRDQFGLLRDENGMVTGGTEGGLLQRILGNVGGAATNEVNSLRNSIKQLVFEVSQFDTIEATFNAGANSLRENLGGALSDVLEGTKSVKEGFADLATGILKSMQRVLTDRIAEDFINVLAGKAEGTFMERFFKPKNTTGVDTSDSGPLGPVTEPGQLPQTGVQTAATAPTTGIGGAIASSGAGFEGMVGTPVSIVGGRGGSSGEPLFVSIVKDPFSGAKEKSREGEGGVGAAGTGALSDSAEATEKNTEATKQLSLETAKAGLQTASMVTAGLATVAALTGNEKAARALAVVTALLQAATVALTIATNLQTTGNIFGFRQGGIASPTGPMKGYSTGGIAQGSQSGYPAVLHGTEAVVPLPNGKSIPVEVSGGGTSMNQNNVNVNVVMNSDGSAQSKTTEQEGRDAAELGRSISIAVQEELKKQKRSGGMLSPYGVA